MHCEGNEVHIICITSTIMPKRLHLTFLTQPLQTSFTARKRRYGCYQMTHDSQLPLENLCNSVALEKGVAIMCVCVCVFVCVYVCTHTHMLEEIVARWSENNSSIKDPQLLPQIIPNCSFSPSSILTFFNSHFSILPYFFAAQLLPIKNVTILSFSQSENSLRSYPLPS